MSEFWFFVQSTKANKEECNKIQSQIKRRIRKAKEKEAVERCTIKALMYIEDWRRQLEPLKPVMKNNNRTWRIAGIYF